VCHSDLSIKNGYVPMPPGYVLGHEGAGTIVEVGKDVTAFAKGDKVIASFIPACGTCVSCLNDETHLCDTEFEVMTTPRGTRKDGSPYLTMTGLGTFAEAMTVSETSLVKINTDIPFDQLALIRLLARLVSSQLTQRHTHGERRPRGPDVPSRRQIRGLPGRPQALPRHRWRTNPRTRQDSAMKAGHATQPSVAASTRDDPLPRAPQRQNGT